MVVMGAYYVFFLIYMQVLIFKTGIINLGCNSHFQPSVVNSRGYTPLRLAVINEGLKIVKYLTTEQNIDLRGMYMLCMISCRRRRRSHC